MKVKDSLLYKYEKPFVNELVGFENLRPDGRKSDEYRNLDIQYGKEWGVCIVSLGETKVMAQVTCDVQQPKTTRPNEGLLYLNVELGQMAAPNIDQNQLSELNVHLNRILEKCIKESHCLDLEALCIVAEEKVWNVRVDIVVINYEGNMIGCSSIAALAALCHFRRPDFTIDGESVIIHTHAEKDLIPLSIHHHPVAITFAIFDNGNRILSDPTDLEERASQAELIIGMNTFRELCGIHLSGTVFQKLNVLIQCSQNASRMASVLVQKIKDAIEIDLEQRKNKELPCLVENIDVKRQLALSQCRSSLLNKNLEITVSDSETKEQAEKITKFMQSGDASGCIAIGDDDDDDDIEIIEVIESGTKSADTVHRKKRKKDENIKTWSNVEDDDDDTYSYLEIDYDCNNDIAEESYVKCTNDIAEESDVKCTMSYSDADSDDDIALVKEITLEDRIVEHIELTGDSEEEDVQLMDATDIDNITNKKVVTSSNVKGSSKEIKNENK